MVYIKKHEFNRLIKMTLGERIKQARKAKELTQEELSERTGLGLGQISKIERGDIKDPKLSTMEKLMDGLEIGADKLIVSKHETRLSLILKNKMEELNKMATEDIAFVIRIIDNLSMAEKMREAVNLKEPTKEEIEEEMEWLRAVEEKEKSHL